jgi:hypothetical protein
MDGKADVPHRLAKRPELLVTADGNRDPTVVVVVSLGLPGAGGATVDPVRRPGVVGIPVTDWLRIRAILEVIHNRGRDQSQPELELGEVDIEALASSTPVLGGLETGESAGEPAQVVRQRKAVAVEPLPRRVRQEGEPTERVDCRCEGDEVAPRPGLPHAPHGDD